MGGDLALQAMYTLSGGQKSRVAFAKVTFTKPQILLLDEPSNHLDLDAVQALIQVSIRVWTIDACWLGCGRGRRHIDSGVGRWF